VACKKRYAVELGKPQRFQEIWSWMDSVQGIMKPNSSELKEQKPWWETCWTPDVPLNADGVSYQAYYSEVGKAHYMGKDLTEVRSPQRKLVPDNVGLGEYEQTSLRGIAIKANALRESEYNRGTGCGKTARPGLCGGRWVTGVPTARGHNKYVRLFIRIQFK